MSIQEEYVRLESLVTDFSLTQEQRQAASDALDEIDNRSILEDWKTIENNGDQLAGLTQRLGCVITDIKNNSNISTSIDEVSEILNDVAEMANAD